MFNSDFNDNGNVGLRNFTRRPVGRFHRRPMDQRHSPMGADPSTWSPTTDGNFNSNGNFNQNSNFNSNAGNMTRQPLGGDPSAWSPTTDGNFNGNGNNFNQKRKLLDGKFSPIGSDPSTWSPTGDSNSLLSLNARNRGRIRRY